jgi:hypothetical protein
MGKKRNCKHVESEPDVTVEDGYKIVARTPEVPAKRLKTSPSTHHQLGVGTRISVWWPNYKRYYLGTTKKYRCADDRCFIVYDDGDKLWTDLSTAKYKVVLDDMNESNDASQIQVGSRVRVYWDRDGRFHLGRVTRKHKSNPEWWYVEYYNGESIAWVDFGQTIFRLVNGTSKKLSSTAQKKHAHHAESSVSETQKEQKILQRKAASRKELKSPLKQEDGNKNHPQLQIGDRLEIWWEDDQAYYAGCIIKKRKKVKPFLIAYDDGDTEWLDLREETYRLLPCTTKSGRQPEDNSRKKLETTEKEHCAVLESAVGKQKARGKVPSKKKWRGRASKAIEQIDPKTGEVVAVFASQTLAASETGIYRRSIWNVLQQGAKLAGGYSWRYCPDSRKPTCRRKTGDCRINNTDTLASIHSTKSSEDCDDDSSISSWCDDDTNESGRDSVNLSDETSTFAADDSTDEMETEVTHRHSPRQGISAVLLKNKKSQIDSTNADDKDIEEHLLGITRARESKVTATLSSPKQTKAPKAVEQIDAQTGKVVAVFESQSLAAKKTGIHLRSIWNALRQDSKLAGGYFWKYSEYKRKPNAASMDSSGGSDRCGKDFEHSTDNDEPLDAEIDFLCHSDESSALVEDEDADDDTKAKILSIGSNDHEDSHVCKDGALECPDLSLLKVGSEIAVWWDGDRKYYPAQIKEVRSKAKKQFYVEYKDDSFREWIDLRSERFQLLPLPQKTGTKHALVESQFTISCQLCDQVQVGSSVNVWWHDDATFYSAVVKQIQKDRQKQFLLLYDDDGMEEWIDLRKEKFQLLSANTAENCSNEKCVGKTTLSRRTSNRRCICTPTLHEGSHQSDSSTTDNHDQLEISEIEKTSGSRKWDRAATVSLQQRSNAPKAVEQIDAETGKVVAVFESQSLAAKKTGIHLRSIWNALRQDSKQAGGHFWRYRIDNNDLNQPRFHDDEQKRSMSAASNQNGEQSVCGGSCVLRVDGNSRDDVLVNETRTTHSLESAELDVDVMNSVLTSSNRNDNQGESHPLSFNSQFSNEWENRYKIFIGTKAGSTTAT